MKKQSKPTIPLTPRPQPLSSGAILALAALSGFGLYAANPPMDLGPLGFIALTPLFIALFRCRRPAFGALAGFVCGIFFFGALVGYISMYGLVPWLALTLFQALFFAVAGYLIALLAASVHPLYKLLGAAAAWCLAELLRGHVGPVSLTLGELCYTQHDLPPILQIASIFGPQGVSFLLAVTAAGLAGAITCGPDRKLRARLVVYTYGIVLLAYIGGGIEINHNEKALERMNRAGGGMNVALVQGNVKLHTPVTEQDAQRSKEVYPRLTRDLLPGTDLVVWPETALPVVLNAQPEYLQVAQETARRAGAYMLIGGMEEDLQQQKIYNTAYLFSPLGQIVDRYRKVDLVMYGEYVPGRDRFKFLSRYPIRSFDVSPGPERKPLDVKGTKLGVLICFEGIFPQPTRDVCIKGAQVIVTTTSDAWAADSSEVLQHSATAPLRAVEARKFLVRSATTGQSAVIAPWGEVIDQVPAYSSGMVEGKIRPVSGLSLYHQWGDWPLLGILLALWAAAFMYGRLAAED